MSFETTFRLALRSQRETCALDPPRLNSNFVEGASSPPAFADRTPHPSENALVRALWTKAQPPEIHIEILMHGHGTGHGKME